jgi:hypothetical protein
VFVPRLFTSYGVKLWDDEPLEPEPWESEVPEVAEVLSLLDMITKMRLSNFDE